MALQRDQVVGRIANLIPHPLNGFICTTIYYCLLPVAIWASFSDMENDARCAPSAKQ